MSDPWYRQSLKTHGHWSLQQLRVVHKGAGIQNQARAHMMAPARIQPPIAEARTLQLATTALLVKRPQSSQGTLPHTKGSSYA
jgi:hypothetical protein